MTKRKIFVKKSLVVLASLSLLSALVFSQPIFSWAEDESNVTTLEFNLDAEKGPVWDKASGSGVSIGTDNIQLIASRSMKIIDVDFGTQGYDWIQIEISSAADAENLNVFIDNARATTYNVDPVAIVPKVIANPDYGYTAEAKFDRKITGKQTLYIRNSGSTTVKIKTVKLGDIFEYQNEKSYMVNETDWGNVKGAVAVGDNTNAKYLGEKVMKDNALNDVFKVSNVDFGTNGLKYLRLEMGTTANLNPADIAVFVGTAPAGDATVADADLILQGVKSGNYSEFAYTPTANFTQKFTGMQTLYFVNKTSSNFNVRALITGGEFPEAPASSSPGTSSTPETSSVPETSSETGSTPQAGDQLIPFNTNAANGIVWQASSGTGVTVNTDNIHLNFSRTLKILEVDFGTKGYKGIQIELSSEVDNENITVHIHQYKVMTLNIDPVAIISKVKTPGPIGQNYTWSATANFDRKITGKQTLYIRNGGGTNTPVQVKSVKLIGEYEDQRETVLEVNQQNWSNHFGNVHLTENGKVAGELMVGGNNPGNVFKVSGVDFGEKGFKSIRVETGSTAALDWASDIYIYVGRAPGEGIEPDAIVTAVRTGDYSYCMYTAIDQGEFEYNFTGVQTLYFQNKSSSNFNVRSIMLKGISEAEERVDSGIPGENESNTDSNSNVDSDNDNTDSNDLDTDVPETGDTTFVPIILIACLVFGVAFTVVKIKKSDIN